MNKDEQTGDVLAQAEDLLVQQRPAEAAKLLRARIDAGRGGALARILLVRALIASGETGDALAVARETVQLNPSLAAAAAALGEVLRYKGHLPTAIGEFQRALRLDPSSAEARFQLGRAWLDAGEPAKALEAFEAIAPGTVAGLEGAIAEAEAMQSRPRADAGYVRHLFDQFSADYDARMRGQLGYQAPEILKSLAELVLPQRTRLSILDLGCGTGLCGVAFKDMAARLEGIDLSPRMIAKARARNIYDALAVADIEKFLAGDGPRYDLVLAADTLVYLGDLRPIFEGVRRRLDLGGFFLFTVEKKTETGFELGPKRRWRHSDSYLREEAARCGFDVTGMLDCVPRTEAGEPVAGLAVALSPV